MGKKKYKRIFSSSINLLYITKNFLMDEYSNDLPTK